MNFVPGERIGGQLSGQVGQFSNQPEQVTYVTGQFSDQAGQYSGDQGQLYRQQYEQPRHV